MAYTTQANIDILSYGDYGVNDDVENTDLNDMLDAFTALSDNIVDILGADASPTRDISEIESDLATAESDIDTLQASIATGIKVCTANYTILDDDGYGIIVIDSRTGAKTITLPTLADNQSRTIKFIVSHQGGNVTIDGEGAETINGLASIVLGGQYNQLEIVGTASSWLITSMRASSDTGWIGRSDWSNVSMGSTEINYDNLSGTFTVGEVVTESDTGNTWVIVSDSGSKLVCKNATGTGYATNNKVLTGATSGATADVNEGAGNTKNTDTNVTHNLGYGVQNIYSRVLVSQNKTEALTYSQFQGQSGTAASQQGTSLIGVNTTSYTVKTSASGFFVIDNVINSEDYYYKIITEVVI